LDAFNSDDPGAYIAGFPPHPHRGFETVTYMLNGALRHRDNKGNVGLLGPGDLQWMSAARGIVHSEMPEQRDGLMRGFQFWLNLPAKDKMSEPRYRDVAAKDIPTVALGEGVSAKLLAGSIGEASAVVETGATEPLLLDLVLASGASVDLPVAADHNAFLYVYEGAVQVGSEARAVSATELAVLSLGAGVTLKASDEGARLIFAAAKPLREPIAKYGPFVMNTEAEIKQAIADFRAGKF
ncbi:MAG TPA: pirin family protein, partial [Methylovirgula sp.]|nr:pirin family protein [Methylovirgula sp.]